MSTHSEPHFRFSKLLRSGARGEVFSPGSPLRIARAIDAESLKGRHEGRGRKTAGGGVSVGVYFSPFTQASTMLAHSCSMWRRWGSYSALL